jgi:CRISPR-associated endoribonuclease Cas6
MRITLNLELKKNVMSIEYRREILSFIKASLTNYKNGEYFDKFYKENKPLMKPFSFAVMLSGAKFQANQIDINTNSIKVVFSTNDTLTANIFYNAFCQMQFKEYPLANENTMQLKEVCVDNIFITQDEIKIKFLSPLCVRSHNKETNKDFYLSYGKSGFEETLKQIIRVQLKEESLPEKLIEGFAIEGISAKKTVIKHFNLTIETTIGMFILKGNPLLLNFLYHGGIGSRKSSGCGLFELIVK